MAKMDKQTRLLVGLGLVGILAFIVLPLAVSRGISFTVSNQYGEPIQGASCEVYGSPTAYCTSNNAGYCYSSTSSSYTNGIYSYACICKSNNKRTTGNEQVWDLGIRNVGVVLQDCVSGYQAPTTTLSPTCIPNDGYFVNNAYECCSTCGSGTTKKCKACNITTTVRTTVVTSYVSTTLVPASSCISPNGRSGQTICSGDALKQCVCGSVCQWTVIDSCSEQCGCGEGGDGTDYTIPTTLNTYPTTQPTYVTTTIPDDDDGIGGGSDVLAIAVGVGVVAIAYLLIKRKK